MVGGAEQRLTQASVAGFGGPAGASGHARGVLVGHEPGERSDRGQVGEPGDLTEPAGDLRCADTSDAWGAAHDPVGVDALVELGDAPIQPLISSERASAKRAWNGDAGSEVVEIEALAGPQRQRRVCGGDDRTGALVVPRATAGAAEKLSPLKNVWVVDGVIARAGGAA